MSLIQIIVIPWVNDKDLQHNFKAIPPISNPL